MQFLIAHCRLLDCRNDRLQLFFRFFELVVQLDNLIERRRLIFRLSRSMEKSQQFFGVGNRNRTELDRLVLFRRYEKVSVFFEQLFGRFPPALPPCFVEYVTNQPLANLLGGRFTAQTFHDVTNHGDGILFGLFSNR